MMTTEREMKHVQQSLTTLKYFITGNVSIRTLVEEGHACGLNRVARLMQQAGIVPKTVKKFRVTTDSRKSHRPAPNLLARDFNASRPNEKWVADVTYVPTREGWFLLAVVLDLFSRRVFIVIFSLLWDYCPL